ncbi:uncharacterized protein LOC135703349 [Ochlerotatus camptorhynchus]|uniref:uncharacterized protein LOC135703349 n=1 Tax=Ochlerotatus camptorhynchus TaxID=644619 RepID=UPI0031D38237
MTVENFGQQVADYVQLLDDCSGVPFSLQIGRRGECRVLAETLDGFKCLLKYLTEKKHKFFTYDTKTERVFKVVMKGLPSGESLDQIKDELAKLLGVVPLQVIKMKMKSRPGDSRNGISNDFYLVHFKSSELNNLKALEKASLMLHVRVKWEHFRKTGGNFQNLTQCRKCQGWGHGTKNCYMPAKCMNCGDSSHAKDDCPVKEDPKKFKCSNCGENHKSNFWECKTRKAILQSCDKSAAAAHCINCGGPHRPNNRQCPVYKKEVEVIRLKVDHNLTYPEARKRVETGTGSYAAAAAQQTADRKKLEELEKKMEEKDAQIAQLLEVMKKKDEKIDKLLGHIKLIRTPQVQQTPLAQPSKPIHPSESQSNQAIDSNLHSQLMRKSGESQIGTPSMHLRSRSPATTESKHNKKKKRHDRSNNTSPGRQSPPLKKPVEKTPTSDQETISVDEDEIEETPPSQHLR